MTAVAALSLCLALTKPTDFEYDACYWAYFGNRSETVYNDVKVERLGNGPERSANGVGLFRLNDRRFVFVDRGKRRPP